MESYIAATVAIIQGSMDRRHKHDGTFAASMLWSDELIHTLMTLILRPSDSML